MIEKRSVFWDILKKMYLFVHTLKQKNMPPPTPKMASSPRQGSLLSPSFSVHDAYLLMGSGAQLVKSVNIVDTFEAGLVRQFSSSANMHQMIVKLLGGWAILIYVLLLALWGGPACDGGEQHLSNEAIDIVTYVYVGFDMTTVLYSLLIWILHWARIGGIDVPSVNDLTEEQKKSGDVYTQQHLNAAVTHYHWRDLPDLLFHAVWTAMVFMASMKFTDNALTDVDWFWLAWPIMTTALILSVRGIYQTYTTMYTEQRTKSASP